MADDDLRTQLRRACAEADRFDFDSLEPHDYQRHADLILAVVQPELDRLGTENTVLHQALREHESCSACGHERHQHEQDPILRAEWCRACTTLDDLHDFTPTTEE